jgi:hypothetical protein
MYQRETYDPTRSMVARKTFTCQGVNYTPGKKFEGVVDDRRLRQMYETRWLAVEGSKDADSAVRAYKATQKKAKGAKKPGLLDSIGV